MLRGEGMGGFKSKTLAPDQGVWQCVVPGGPAVCVKRAAGPCTMYYATSRWPKSKMYE